MTIIDAGETSHIIKIIPRVYNAANTHVFTITDDDLRTSTDVSHTKALNNGYIDYTLTLATSEGKSYSVKVTDSTTTLVVSRFKIFATEQTTQAYRINE